MILVDAQGVSVSRPDKPLFTDLALTVSTGDRVGVVGINGCGKSTLLRVLAGAQQPDAGVVRRGRDARIGVLEQDPVLPKVSVREAVGEGWRGESVLDRLGMTPMLETSTAELSGGQRKRVALARLLVHEHDLLILDEPTNHLDLDAIAFLEEWLVSFRGGLLLVTHDRHLLDAVTTSVLELDRGRAYLHVPAGRHAGSGYAAYLAGRAEREEQAAASEAVRRSLAKTELAWLRRGAPARTSKPKARIAAATAVVDGRADAPARRGDLELGMGTARLGSQAIELHAAAFSWPDGTRVLAPLDHVFEPGDRVGIVGPNGAGKSTFTDLIAGRREPTEGRVVRGRTVKIGYYDQLGRDLPLERRVRDVVARDKAEPTWDDVRLMERFWFDADAQFAPIGTLSGGERRRLQLLLVLLEKPNVLLLDEPTNDLDLDTLRALEDLLSDWPGLLVVVSHDRAFLDRTVSDVMAIDGDGRVRRVRGGVAGWLAERAAARSTSRPGSRSAPRTSTTTTSGSPAIPAAGTARDATPRTVRSGRSPSTLRRLLTAAERRMADGETLVAEAARAYGEGSTDHRELARLAEALAAAQARHAEAEHEWMEIATEMESLGLTP